MQKQLNCCIAVLLLLFMRYTGFVQSLEFLRKSWNLPSSFLDLEKVWKMEIKCGKIVKSLELFFLQSYKKCFISEVFFILVNRTFAPHLERSFVPAFFIDHLFDNLESGERNYLFGKKSRKILEIYETLIYNDWHLNDSIINASKLVRASCLWRISLGKSQSEIDLSGPIIFLSLNDWLEKIFFPNLPFFFRTRWLWRFGLRV